MDFQKSKTFQNIKSAFAGECQAHLAYSFYAAQAEKSGLEPIVSLLNETASNEKEHAEVLFKKINNGGNNQLPEVMEGLSRAILGERHEAMEKYKIFAEIAAQEGFPDIANLFEKMRAKLYNCLYRSKCRRAPFQAQPRSAQNFLYRRILCTFVGPLE